MLTAGRISTATSFEGSFGGVVSAKVTTVPAFGTGAEVASIHAPWRWAESRYWWNIVFPAPASCGE